MWVLSRGELPTNYKSIFFTVFLQVQGSWAHCKSDARMGDLRVDNTVRKRKWTSGSVLIPVISVPSIRGPSHSVSDSLPSIISLVTRGSEWRLDRSTIIESEWTQQLESDHSIITTRSWLNDLYCLFAYFVVFLPAWNFLISLYVCTIWPVCVDKTMNSYLAKWCNYKSLKYLQVTRNCFNII